MSDQITPTPEAEIDKALHDLSKGSITKSEVEIGIGGLEEVSEIAPEVVEAPEKEVRVITPAEREIMEEAERSPGPQVEVTEDDRKKIIKRANREFKTNASVEVLKGYEEPGKQN